MTALWRGRLAHARPTIVRVDGPYRVRDDQADKGDQPRPVGFTADLDGTPKPATALGDDVIEAAIQCAHDIGPCPDGCTGPMGDGCQRRARCPECGDCDGYHFRCCPNHPKEDPWQ